MAAIRQMPSAANKIYSRRREKFGGPAGAVLFAPRRLWQIVLGTSRPRSQPLPTPEATTELPHAAAQSRYWNHPGLFRPRHHRGPLGFPEGIQGPRQLLPRREDDALVHARGLRRLRDVRYQRDDVARLRPFHLRP